MHVRSRASFMLLLLAAAPAFAAGVHGYAAQLDEAVAQLRSAASVLPFPSAAEHSQSAGVMKSALPAGTVQVRVTVAWRLSWRYQTGPDWPTAQSAPVLSIKGL